MLNQFEKIWSRTNPYPKKYCICSKKLKPMKKYRLKRYSSIFVVCQCIVLILMLTPYCRCKCILYTFKTVWESLFVLMAPLFATFQRAMLYIHLWHWICASYVNLFYSNDGVLVTSNEALSTSTWIIMSMKLIHAKLSNFTKFYIPDLMRLLSFVKESIWVTTLSYKCMPLSNATALLEWVQKGLTRH